MRQKTETISIASKRERERRMYYNKFQDKELSGLGFGCMRLPVIDGDDNRPDQAAVQVSAVQPADMSTDRLRSTAITSPKTR